MNQTHQHTVAYPGPPGSHASAAAAALFPRENLVPVGGFHAVADAVVCADAAHGVLPIESSLAGTVAETHDLLNEHSLSIVAEAVLPIHHVLAAPADVPLDEIRVVRSHPTALEQCRGLLKRMPRATAMPAATTAEAAREAAEVGDPTVAAIAGAGAAALYGLVVLEDDVGDGPAFTRFVSIAPYTWLGGARNDARTAFTFVTDHRPGALYHALGPIARAGLDLVRIDSRPIPATPWSYRFDAVIAGHPLDTAVRTALAELGEMTRSHRVLGVYEAAEEAK
jgi:chorismate mutase/prephenate dehydratase